MRYQIEKIIKGTDKVIQLERETLTDGSTVFNVLVSDRTDKSPVVLPCLDFDSADKLIETIRKSCLL